MADLWLKNENNFFYWFFLNYQFKIINFGQFVFLASYGYSSINLVNASNCRIFQFLQVLPWPESFSCDLPYSKYSPSILLNTLETCQSSKTSLQHLASMASVWWVWWVFVYIERNGYSPILTNTCQICVLLQDITQKCVISPS